MKTKENIEEWRDIPGYEGLYKISSIGRLKSVDRVSSIGKQVKGIIRKLAYNKKGYLMTSLCKNGVSTTKTIHRMVAKAFIPNPNNLPQINHKNGIKTDNGVDNLEWCTNLENMQHAFSTGLKEGLTGENNGRAILSQEEVDYIKTKYNNGEKAKEIAKELNLKLSMVRYILNDGGWKFTYIDVEKRDDRANWTKEHSINSLLSKFNKGEKPAVVVAQYTKEGKEIGKYRSINNAAIQTGVPRKSIEANVHNKAKHAGGFLWKKIEVDINQYKELI